MNLSKRFSLALAALVLVLAGSSSAFAQAVTFNLATAPTFVANTGRSEVMGQVTLTADIICGTGADGFCISQAGTIQILFSGTPIDNGFATANIGTITTNGIEICEVIGGGAPTCNTTGTYLAGPAAPSNGFTIVNTSAGGVVSFGVLGAVDFAAGDQIVMRGVRGQIDLGPGNVVGTAIIGQLTASPSTIASFVPTSEVVARSADPLTMAFGPWTILQCRPGIGVGTVTVTEGFNVAFVDHDVEGATDGTNGTTINLRPLFGGSRNSRINIVLTGLPSGVTINWPATSAVDNGGGATGAFLNLVSQGTRGTTALYTFSSVDQAISDINGERFVITVTAAANVLLSGTPSDFGTSTGQGQMFDAATSTGSRPRYNHPLEPVPAATWLTVAPCTTNLLYPYVINTAPTGVDTGLAISNTSADPYGTVGQTGSCAVNLYPTDLTTLNGVSAGGAITVTTAPLQPGSIWRAIMSGTPAFAGRGGYIIAVCNFQYGHGFAFITDNFGTGLPAGVAQGYLALVIPDPVILGGTPGCGTANNPAGNYRSAAVAGDDRLPAICAPPYGEGLGM
jgi:hypothetical protein